MGSTVDVEINLSLASGDVIIRLQGLRMLHPSADKSNACASWNDIVGPKLD